MTEEIIYSDTELLLLVKQGDEHAFSQLYLRYYRLLRPFVWKLTNSATDTEEIIQETFIRVWLYRDKLDEITHFRAWVFKVASRENLNYLRRKIRLDKQSATTLPAQVHTPVQELQAGELKALIRQAVDLLPEQRRKIYQLSRDKGLTVDEIATSLSISPRTVYNSLTTALRQIREHLGSSGYELPLLFILFEKYF